MDRDTPAALALVAFTGAFVGDLLTKAYFVASPELVGVTVVYNGKDPELLQRALGCVAAFAVVAALVRLGRWRGIDEPAAAWIGAGVLVGGIAGNGVSAWIFPRGVPDFIPMPENWLWNLADFEIGIGLLVGTGAFAVAAARAYRRDLAARQ